MMWGTFPCGMRSCGLLKEFLGDKITPITLIAILLIEIFR